MGDQHRRGRGRRVTLRVTDGEQGGWAVLQVSGEMDLVTSPVLRQRVHDAVADGRHSLVLDLSDVLFCDSSGVGVLIATRRLISSCQGRLRLILPAQGAVDGSHVNRVLGALGVRRLFDVYPDVGAAVDDESSPLSA
ncbi:MULTISPECIES: STAS domain-containing protein [Streptomyces aurantiacus group]|uniref:STAS domain-containing protein n=1 Tax=Streptomyces aurantiacus group TaxID=2838335 RepID=UPI00068B0C7C|nr:MULTISPECIES: STAS domain-containing protein [Streptomyces]